MRLGVYAYHIIVTFKGTLTCFMFILSNMFSNSLIDIFWVLQSLENSPPNRICFSYSCLKCSLFTKVLTQSYVFGILLAHSSFEGLCVCSVSTMITIKSTLSYFFFSKIWPSPIKFFSIKQQEVLIGYVIAILKVSCPDDITYNLCAE